MDFKNMTKEARDEATRAILARRAKGGDAEARTVLRHVEARQGKRWTGRGWERA